MKKLIFILLFALCACAPSSTPSSMAYITNQGDNTVSVIDIKQHKVIDTIKVGKAPVGVARNGSCAFAPGSGKRSRFVSSLMKCSKSTDMISLSRLSSFCHPLVPTI